MFCFLGILFLMNFASFSGLVNYHKERININEAWKQKKNSIQNFGRVLFHSDSVFSKGTEVFSKNNSHFPQILSGYIQVQFSLNLKAVEVISHTYYFSWT